MHFGWYRRWSSTCCRFSYRLFDHQGCGVLLCVFQALGLSLLLSAIRERHQGDHTQFSVRVTNWLLKRILKRSQMGPLTIHSARE
jgi:hypothetical protein